MAILKDYYRPQNLRDALQLLARQDVRLAPLAGGTKLVGQLETRQITDVDGVVDLSALGLNFIEKTGDTIRIGATTTLTDIMAHDVAGALADGVLRRTGRYEGPVNMRNVATIGGLVAAAEPDSEFYAALLALDASLVISHGDGETDTRLAEFAGVAPGQLIVEVRLPVAEGRCGHARVARTPSDRCIVAAVAVVDPSGERVALCGVAPRPVLDGGPLDPPSDFKGSKDYRLAMIDVVKQRALQEARR
jgi:CO/xanthine dehydrogenase FAD-binding subunit